MGKSGFYENKFGNVFGNMIATPVGRAALCWVDKPSEKFKPAKYGCHILFSKTDESIKAGLDLITVHVQELIAHKYGDTTPVFKYPAFRDGDEMEYQGFYGTMYLGAKSTKKPEVIGPDKRAIDSAQILPGMLIRLVVTPLLFDDGVAYQLSTVQLVKDDGVRYYGGPDPKSLLDAVEPDPSLTPVNDEPADGKQAAINML